MPLPLYVSPRQSVTHVHREASRFPLSNRSLLMYLLRFTCVTQPRAIPPHCHPPNTARSRGFPVYKVRTIRTIRDPTISHRPASCYVRCAPLSVHTLENSTVPPVPAFLVVLGTFCYEQTATTWVLTAVSFLLHYSCPPFDTGRPRGVVCPQKPP